MSDIKDVLQFLREWKDDTDKHLLDKISLGVSNGLKEYSKEQDKVCNTKLELHEEKCPARRSIATIKYVIGIPFIASFLLWYFTRGSK